MAAKDHTTVNAAAAYVGPTQSHEGPPPPKDPPRLRNIYSVADPDPTLVQYIWQFYTNYHETIIYCSKGLSHETDV